MELDYNPKSQDSDDQKPYRNIVNEVSVKLVEGPTVLDSDFDGNNKVKLIMECFCVFSKGIVFDRNFQRRSIRGRTESYTSHRFRNVVPNIFCYGQFYIRQSRFVQVYDVHNVSSLFYSFFFLYLLFLPFVSFAYEDLSMAVNEYYLKEESDRLMFVQKLSNYFEGKFQVTKVTY